ncbi:hypothetical protein KDW_07270 [Dictyobacter vulcani]|uniref:Uncharacterized protein n=1 Tax=Dictyobacter vulcani TaxID=2607529 RepID=A0A5J4KGG3_9CHLR|nr:hypothetical protein [Dictyobacter vulcani]GER86565.1 hypothetical protein KDW_07270 [Dictyobacter vulcani]
MRYARRNGKKFKESDFVSLQQRLNEMIHEDTSELHTLIATVSTESLAKIKQEVSIRYLELLAKQISDNPQERNYDRRSIYLHTLTTRLKKIKEYLLAYPNDTEYQVYYDGSMILTFRLNQTKRPPTLRRAA